MKTWKEVVDTHIIKHSDKVKKITKPLRDRENASYYF